MFDFRYHALSLVSVFLALVLGLLLGVAIGDRGLVSSAERDMRASLRGDVRKAQAESENLRAQLDEQNKFLQEAYPLMVGSRLIGERVGVVTLGDVSDQEIGNVRDALEATGGRLTSVVSIRTPLDLPSISTAAAGTAFQNLQVEPKLVKRFGERVGVGYVSGGGRLLDKVHRDLLASSSGALGGVDSVVVIREPRTFQKPQQNILDDFEDGLMTGLSNNNGTVVGVETHRHQALPGRLVPRPRPGLGRRRRPAPRPGRAGVRAGRRRRRLRHQVHRRRAAAEGGQLARVGGLERQPLATVQRIFPSRAAIPVTSQVLWGGGSAAHSRSPWSPPSSAPCSSRRSRGDRT